MPEPDRKTNNKDLNAVLIAQAKVRTGLGMPICALMLATVWYWDAPLDSNRILQLLMMTVLYGAYNLGSLIAAAKGLFDAERSVLATAVLDPLMLSAWLMLTDEAAPLFIGFYIFTILGFGFRIGTRPMWLAQAASVLGFGAVIAASEFWQENLTLSASVLILLVAVPLYATILIKKLLDAREVAEFESRAKTKLLANVSHELRTPLNGIVATAHLLKSGNHSAEVVSYSESILRMSDDLLYEINDLLDSAKYHAHAAEIVEAPFRLQDIADHLQMALAPGAQAKGIRLSTELDPEIVDAIRSDKHQLMRVLKNIAGNAVKFTDSGEVHIHMALLEHDEQSYTIRFSVRDTGIGIPLSEQARIFEPFYRGPENAQRNYPGTGLGMSIAQDIVAAMGSRLNLESQTGKGSVFYFDLRAAREPGINMSAAGTAGNVPAAEVAQGRRILAVEDHPVNRMLLKKILEIDHHAVTVAETGTRALELLANQDFDLVILDYNLDDIDGLTVMQRYHASMQYPAPIYFLTADATDATKANLMEKGAANVLHKPLTLEALRRVIASQPSSDRSTLPFSG